MIDTVPDFGQFLPQVPEPSAIVDSRPSEYNILPYSHRMLKSANIADDIGE